MIHIHFHWYQFLHLWSGEAVIYGNSLFPYPWCFPSLHRESNWITCITARHTVCTLRGPLIHVRPFTTTKTMVISPAPFPPKSPVTNFQNKYKLVSLYLILFKVKLYVKVVTQYILKSTWQLFSDQNASDMFDKDIKITLPPKVIEVNKHTRYS